ncbi:alpha/beta hydrolase [Salegentibacter chungangensis]|uniref:Alpha/beta hydrolase n=1 Tax=Salegentibacter chungangensis TaxID=1335724 RepID=A0ABW3NN11_9FLAO
MKSLLLLATFLVPVLSLTAQERYIDSLFPVKEVVTETYATKDGKDLIADIYLPEKDTASLRPMILFMHGGGFAGGSPKNEAEVKFAKIAASKGYVAVQISYRLERKDKKTAFGCEFPAEGKIETFRKAAEDFLDAVKYMKRISDKYNIDPTQIIVGGSSAGAEAVLDAVYNRQLLLPENNQYEDLGIDGVFSLAGAIVDARYIIKENAIPAVLFHGTDDNLVPYATAPHHYCDPSEPGFIILDGSKTIADKLEEFNSSYMLYTFEGARHEISGIPFHHLPEVFSFFKKAILQKNHLQINISQ